VLALATPAAAALARTASTTGGSAGGIGIRLLQAPAALKDDPRARVYVIDHLNPGTTIRRAIEVDNTTTSTREISLYAGGARIVNDAFVPGPDNDLSSWITVNPSRLVLRPGSSQTAEVTLAVPSTAPSGERYADIWAQVTTDVSGINVVDRVGIRVYLDVGPGGYPATTFNLGPLSISSFNNGRPVIGCSVDNTGQRAIDVSGSLMLRYLGGSVVAGPYALARNLTIPPGSTGEVTVNVTSELPSGRWQASLKVTADTVTHVQTNEISVEQHGAAIVPSSSLRRAVCDRRRCRSRPPGRWRDCLPASPKSGVGELAAGNSRVG
jgi:hypothetical protein